MCNIITQILKIVRKVKEMHKPYCQGRFEEMHTRTSYGHLRSNNEMEGRETLT